MKNIAKFILIASAVGTFSILSVFGQTTRVYVANSGSDANQCTKSAECKTITKALTAVDDGGEVIITESGDYDTFAVSKSVTVAAADGVDAEIVSSVQFAIWINSLQPPQLIDKVTIRNLHLKNISTLSSSAGIFNSSGSNLFVDNCTFTGFGTGIGEAFTVGKLFVHDSTFRNNDFGVNMNTPTLDGGLTGIFDNCKFEQNHSGIRVQAKSFATIRNSIFVDNSVIAISVSSIVASLKAEAVIENCQISGNVAGIKVGNNAGPSFVRVSRSTVTGNNVGIWVLPLGTFSTFQNNVIVSNITDISGGINPLQLK